MKTPILLIFTILITISQSSVTPNDKLEDDVYLNDVRNTYTPGLGVYYTDITYFPDGKFAHAYIDSNDNVMVSISQNGAIIAGPYGPINSNTVEVARKVYIIALDDVNAVVFWSQIIGSGKSFLNVINIDTGVIENAEEQCIKNVSNGQYMDKWITSIKKIDNNRLAVLSQHYTTGPTAHYFYEVYTHSSPAGSRLTGGNRVADRTGGRNWKGNLAVLTQNNKVVVVFKIEDPAPTHHIYYQFMDFDGNKIGNNVLVPGYGVDYTQLDFIEVEATQSGGFAFTWVMPLSGECYFANFDNDGNEICLKKVIDKGKYPVLAVWKDTAFIAYTQWTSFSQYKDYLASSLAFVTEIDLATCNVRFTEQISSQGVSQHINLSVNVGSQVSLLGINYVVNPGTYQLNYSEYYLEQVAGTCNNPNCSGCYGTKLDECNMCAGSTPEKRQQRLNLNPSGPNKCECPSGYVENADKDCDQCPPIYYVTPAGTECFACLPSCASCSNDSTCDTCTNANENPALLCICPAISYNDAGGMCQACLPNCASCSNSFSCDTCDDAKLNPQLGCTCPGIYYLDGSGVCQACMNQCLTCSDADTCDSCKDKNMMLDTNCLYSKSQNFLSIDINGLPIISKCAKQCQTCENSASNCLTCNGQNRESNAPSCTCLPGYFDIQGQLQDCEKCHSLCEECSSYNQCSVCKEGLNRVLDPFTGSCKCPLGYKSINGAEMCTKCYMLSNGCVDQCPQNTIQNEITQVCEPLNFGLESNFDEIILFGVVIAIIQIALFVIVQQRLQKKNQEFTREYHEEQMKIKQQRQFIYKDLESNSSGDGTTEKGMNSIYHTSSPEKSNKERRRNRKQISSQGQRSRSMQQSHSNIDDNISDSQLNLVQ